MDAGQFLGRKNKISQNTLACTGILNANERSEKGYSLEVWSKTSLLNTV